jgi:hypothetical protein
MSDSVKNWVVLHKVDQRHVQTRIAAVASKSDPYSRYAVVSPALVFLFNVQTRIAAVASKSDPYSRYAVVSPALVFLFRNSN